MAETGMKFKTTQEKEFWEKVYLVAMTTVTPFSTVESVAAADRAFFARQERLTQELQDLEHQSDLDLYGDEDF